MQIQDNEISPQSSENSFNQKERESQCCLGWYSKGVLNSLLGSIIRFDLYRKLYGKKNFQEKLRSYTILEHRKVASPKADGCPGSEIQFFLGILLPLSPGSVLGIWRASAEASPNCVQSPVLSPNF